MDAPIPLEQDVSYPSAFRRGLLGTQRTPQLDEQTAVLNNRYGETVVQDNAFNIQGDVHMNQPPDPRLALQKSLQYEGMHVRVEQLSGVEIPKDSFAWVWSTSIKPWLGQSATSAPFYWITGKPGSGKSTLMRYLVIANKTRRFVKKSQLKPLLLHFFFDYRAAMYEANNETGLLKTFVRQLCGRYEELEARLAVRNTTEPIDTMSSIRLKDLFCDLLESLDSKIYAFVDGLDEYTGDYAQLVQLLTEIQQRASVKVCLASRPEPVLQRLLLEFPNIRMQDHNAASVRSYIDYAIKKRPHDPINLQVLINRSLRQEIVSRAQGVIIWARHTIDNLVCLACQNPDPAALRSLLAALPEDLHEMYEVTFARICKQNTWGKASEAASLLLFINEFGGSVDLKIIYALWDFLDLNRLCNGDQQGNVDELAFSRRLTALLGSFVEVVGVDQTEKQDTSKQSLGWKIYNFTRTFFANAIDGPATEVRLIHKTVQPFIRKSAFVRSCLPETILTRYPDHVSARVYADVIASATSSAAFNLDHLNYPQNTPGEVLVPDIVTSESMVKAVSKERGKCLEILQGMLVDTKWNQRLHLLAQSIMNFPQAAHVQQYIDKSLGEVWSQVLSSPFMIIELEQHLGRRATAAVFNQYRHNYLDIRLAVEYALPQYLESMYVDVSRADETIWTKMIPEALCVLWLDQSQTHNTRKVPEYASRVNRDLALPQLERVFSFVQSHCTELDVLAIQIAGGARDLNFSSDHRERIRITSEILFSMRSLSLHFGSQRGIFDCGCPQPHLLCAWADGYPPSHPSDVAQAIGECHLEMILAYICKRSDADFNGRCKIFGSPLHKLMSNPAIVLLHGWRPPFVSLAILAKAGANPLLVKFNGRSPLQQFKREIAAEKKVSRSHLELNSKPLIEVFDYYEAHQKWPDFKALARKWDSKIPPTKGAKNDPILHMLDALDDPRYSRLLTGAPIRWSNSPVVSTA